MSEGERIGVLGGTFDPVHNAHLAIAHAALREARLDRVLLVVAARPPHKEKGSHASAADRFAMAQAAAADEPGVEASRLELDRAGPSYTADTLRELAQAHPGARLFLIVGQDSLTDLPGWRESEAILDMARILAAPRAGEPDPPPAVAGKFDMLSLAATPISSTEVRGRIARGEDVGDLVPPRVAALIHERGIYNARVPNSPRQ